LAVLAAAISLAIAVVVWVSRPSAGRAERLASPEPALASSDRPAPATEHSSGPPVPDARSSPSPQALPHVHPEAVRRAEDLLAGGQYLEASQLVDELLSVDPAEPRLRELQAQVAAESRRAAEVAHAEAQQGRAQAGIAAGADRARGPFEAAKQREAEGARLADAGRWAEARAEWLEAARLYQEAEDQASVDAARQRYELERARAEERGVARTLPERFAEALATGGRAEAASLRREPALAVREFDTAAEALEAARAEAAAAARRAAALEADRGAIAAVLAAYASALERKDLAGLKSLWPSLAEPQEAKIRESFAFAEWLSVDVQALDIQVQGGTATAVCRRRDRIVTEEGQRMESDRRAVIRFRKTGGGWVIDAIR
jgi:hypothetical protein